MVKRNPGTTVPTYENVDPVTGEEIPKKQKRFNRYLAVHSKQEPLAEPVLPTTPMQVLLLDVIKQPAFKDKVELERFSSLEEKFKGEHHKLEAEVWRMWMVKIFEWGKKKNIKTVSAICSALENRKSWGEFWGEHRFKVARTLRSTKESEPLVDAYKTQSETW